MKSKLGSTKFQSIIAVLLLLALWQLASVLLDQNLLLPSPISVLTRLFTIWKEEGFAASILFSFSRIALGFFAAFFLGIGLAIASGFVHALEILLRPIMLTIKSVPVASFIIIALIWLSSKNLSTFISFLMVLPVIYNNVLSGIKNVDRKMMEMAKLFKFSKTKSLIYIWMPAVKSHLKAASTTALGMAWKAGIAAEVIGIPSGSIGEQLYMAKAYLNTTDLFAWTVIIVILSLLFERLCLTLLDLVYRKIEKM